MSTLATIRTKVRRLTGRPSPQQITDTQIDEYVNTFYQYDFPEHLRVFSNTSTFKFMTEANVAEYDLRTMQVAFDGGTETAVNIYYNLQPPAYIAGYQSFYSQSREQFLRIYPELGDITSSVTGDGTPGPYTFTLTNVPVLQNSITIGAIDSTGATVKVVDSPVNRTTGNWEISLLETAVTGSINYVTGAGTITFANNIPVGNEITSVFTPYAANRPQAVLFYDNVITLRPVPDKPYPVELNAFLTPSALISSNQAPILNQWWQYLAYGAAKKIFEDSQDPEGVDQIMRGFKEQEQLVLNRHVVQQTNERTATIYTEMVSFPYSNNNRF
jgi:hypothetical protein